MNQSTSIKSKPARRNNDSISKKLVDAIILGMQEKKAIEVTVLDLRKLKNAVTDFFVVCSGNTDTQVDAITDSIEKEVLNIIGEDPWMKEGKTVREWIVLDYIDVVVHVFKKDRRAFYGLEELWGDAKITRYPDAS